MLAVAHIQLDFDLQVPNEPAPVPVFDGLSSLGVTAKLIRGTRHNSVRVLAESAERFRAIPVEAYNHLEVVFQKPEFDRFDASPRDPTNAQVERAANDFLSRLAYFSGSFISLPLRLEDCAWKLDYLSDNRSALIPEDGKFRGHETMSLRGASTIICGPEFWTEFSKLPCNFTAPAWHSLFAQADRAMPHVGNALLLAAIGLEVFIETSFTKHANITSVPTRLWEWIASRNGGRGPSTIDQYSVLLEVLCTYTLKSVPELWVALRSILDARNSFAHEGSPLISGSAVSEVEARELLIKARAIVLKVSSWLPE